MILILSQHREASTDNVMDWIDYLGSASIRLNTSDIYNNEGLITMNISNLGFEINSTIDLNSIKAIWLRRWYEIEDLIGSLKKGANLEANQQLTESIKSEIRAITTYLIFLVKGFGLRNLTRYQ
jgi:hypothetical protein